MTCARCARLVWLLILPPGSGGINRGSERLSNVSESTQLAFTLRSDSKTPCLLFGAVSSAQVSPHRSLRRREKMVIC